MNKIQTVVLSQKQLVHCLRQQLEKLDTLWWDVELKKRTVAGVFEYMMQHRQESMALLKTHPKFLQTLIQKAVEFSSDIPICKQWLSWFFLEKLPSKL